MRRIALALALLCGLASASQAKQLPLPHVELPVVVAQLSLTGVGGGFGGAGSSYVGPGDVITTNWKFWGGLRAFSAAKAGTKAALICDVATGLTCTDVNTLANGKFDTATAAALPQCATACQVAVLYDQSGALACTGGVACDQGNASNLRPVLTFSCLGVLPCMQWTGGGTQQLFAAAAFTAATTQPFTTTMVAERMTVVSFADVGGDFSAGVQFGFDSNANRILAFAGSIPTGPAGNDNVLHAVNIVFNGASTNVNVDGSGSTVSSGAGNISTMCTGSCTNPLVGFSAELGVLTGDQSASFTNLCHNQRIYWGSAGSC